MKLNLKILKVDDVSQSYVDWFSNSEVTRFSNNQFRKFTLESQINYVKDCYDDPNTDLYGIFDGDLHIGNIEINGLQTYHKCAEIKYVVGDTNYWGKGVGSFAISSLIDIARNDYQLNKLYAGTVEDNEGSVKVLKKNGFLIEGRRIKHLFYDGKFHNQLDFGLIL